MEDKNELKEVIVSEDTAMTDVIHENEKTQSQVELQAEAKAAEEIT